MKPGCTGNPHRMVPTAVLGLLLATLATAADPPADETHWQRVTGLQKKLLTVSPTQQFEDAANVREAIDKTHPFCVDVCRGVEAEPGRKDPAALAHFFAEVPR